MKENSNSVILKGFSFRYNDDEDLTLNGISVSFGKGLLHLILGSSGCGKTTLLYAIDGLLGEAVEGTAEGDIIVEKPSNVVKNTALIFQDPDNGFCTFSVEDEIAFGLENIGTDPQKIGGKIQEALLKVNMSGRGKDHITSLSGGEKQKIAIGCGIATDAEIYLFDEPTANLDSTSRKEVSELLCRLKNDEEKTIIIVEHNLRDILPVIDTMTLLDDHGHIRISDKAPVVIAHLLCDKEFMDFPVFLPSNLQILRTWMRNYSDENFVKRAANELLKKCSDGDIKEIPPIEEFILDSLIRKGDYRPLDVIEKKEKTFCGSMIKIENFGFSYPKSEKRILDIPELSIEDGEFTAIVGENGIGKTTFASILVKSLEGYDGNIFVEGKELRQISRKDLYKTIGMVFQNPDWQFITNRLDDELAFSLKNSDKSEEEKENIVDNMLERFDLKDCREKSPFELSQGQKRRLSVAVMLLTEQKLLIFDEPTYGQDYDNRKELMELMRSLNNQGITIVMITHEMDAVAQYADSVICIERDRAVRKLKTREFFDDKETLSRLKQEYPDVYDFSKKLHSVYSDFEMTYDYSECEKRTLDIIPQGGCNV